MMQALQQAQDVRQINASGTNTGDKGAMSWTTLLAPVSGTAEDAAVLAAAAALAAPFGAEVRACFAPLDAAQLMPWMGEGFMGGVQIATLDSLRDAASEGEARARAAFDAAGLERAAFATLPSPVGPALAMEARLSDVIVFGIDAAQGRAPLSAAFQQVLLEERRPVVVARDRPDPSGLAVVAWDGGREAGRAARAAAPWLARCERVVILCAPLATPRHFAPERLAGYLAGRGVNAEIEIVKRAGEPGPILLEAVRRLRANLLVAGAFGHPRFQQFIFGGTTRALIQAETGPALFLAH